MLIKSLKTNSNQTKDKISKKMIAATSQLRIALKQKYLKVNIISTIDIKMTSTIIKNTIMRIKIRFLQQLTFDNYLSLPLQLV